MVINKTHKDGISLWGLENVVNLLLHCISYSVLGVTTAMF